LVLYCNDADLEDFRVSAPNASFRAHYAPNGTLLGPQHASPTEPGGGIAIKSAVFMGSSHPPNTTASLFIARQLAPCFPEIEFRFIGSCLPDESFPANVRRFGVVSDARKHEILQGSDIALNPMAEGSGSNVKVLDYFSHSLPVLSTEFGMRGIHAIDGQHYVAASLGDFETTFRRVAQVADSLRDIGAAGRTLAEEKYGWKGIADSTA
jgi:glycosyltransferase involved in cell wall biosynthesis